MNQPHLGSSDAESRPVSARRVRFIGYLTALTALVLDQASKAWAESALIVGDRHPLLGPWFGLELAYNAGAAFSLASNATAVVTVVAVAGAAVAAWLIWKAASLSWGIGLGLVLGGALANVLDRLLRPPGFGVGHVVDYLAYADWFIGNLADVFVFAGLAVCFVLTVLGKPMRARESDPA